MTTDLAKIQSYVPRAILDQLIWYQQSHNLNSVSQSIATVLAEFFNLDFNQSYSKPAAERLIQRVEQLEATVACLVKRLECIEQGSTTPVVAPVIDQEIAAPFTVSSINHLDSYFLTEGGNISNYSPACFNSEVNHHHSHEQPPSNLNSMDWVVDSDSLGELPQDTRLEIPAIDLSKGISSSMLAKRLETNLATLRKYLRDQKQIQWAALRDPEGLSWTYDSLLHRYYPVPINSEQNPDLSSSILRSPIHSSNCSQELFVQETEKSDVENKSEMVVHPETGLSQAQLSKLTGIPTNTLQRWKQLSDCAQRIQKRTEGKFLYWYCQQYELFYPLGVET